MEPIVYGLEAEFGDAIYFERLDANSERGRAAMSTYDVAGHPSYIMLKPDGTVLWQFTGQIDEAALRVQSMQLLP